MKKLHQRLVGKNGVYAKWHDYQDHQALHWLVFVIVATVLTLPLLSFSINYDPQSQVANVQQTQNYLPQLTGRLVRAIAQHEIASEPYKTAVLNDLLAVARARKQAMLVEARNNPNRFLLLALSPVIAKKVPLEVEKLLEQETEIQGKLMISLFEDIEQRKSKITYSVEDEATGKIYNIHSSKFNQNLKSGSIVRVDGYRIDQEMVIVENISATDGITVVQTDQARSTGEQNTLVILINFMDSSTLMPWTQTEVAEKVFTNTDSVNAYYKDSSFNITSFKGDVTKWITVPYNSTNCSTMYETWTTAANVAVTVAGYTLDNYNRKVYVFVGPDAIALRQSCGFSGWSQLGTDPSNSWIVGDSLYPLNTLLIKHELGHALGMRHAASLFCGQKAIDTYTACTYIEYGDAYDLMGIPLYGFTQNGAHKVQETWVPNTRVQTVTANGTYTIAPLEVAGTAPQILKILKPDTSNISNGSSYYYLEYRQPIGFDQSLPSDITGGVSLVVWPSNVVYGPLAPVRLDTTPGDNNLSNSALSDGRVFFDTINGIRITQLSHNSAGATVKVEFVPGTCVRSNPSISVPTFNLKAPAGETITYEVVVTNNDTSNCSSSTFVVGPSGLPAGFVSSIIPSTVTVNPGSSATIKIAVTSPVDYPMSLISFMITSTDIIDSSYSTSVFATYYVLTRTTSSDPDVTITSPVDGSILINSKKGSLQIAAKSSDSAGIQKAELYLDNKLIKTCTRKATSCSTSIPISNISAGVHTIDAKAYNSKGIQGSASTVRVTKL